MANPKTENPTQATENQKKSRKEVHHPSKQERLWATFVHVGGLGAYIGLPLGNLLVPYILWLIKRNEMPFVKSQGIEALNFNISITLYLLLASVLLTLSFITGIGIFSALGGLFAFVVIIFHVSLVIMASLRANDGEGYRYPYTFRFIEE